MKEIKFWKWILIIVVGGVVFYIFYPKYYFPDKASGFIRCNKITGIVEILDENGNWKKLRK